MVESHVARVSACDRRRLAPSFAISRMATGTQLSPGIEILLLEDDAILRRRLSAHLEALGASVAPAGNLAEARRLARELRLDYAVLDLHLPDGEALTLLRERVFSENTGVVVVTAFGGIGAAVEAMRLGAGDYLTKPFEPEELPLALRRCQRDRAAARREEHRLAAGADGDLFFGAGLAALRAQLDTLLAAERRLAGRPPPVLLEGETGTGKSVLARWLHREGPRAGEPFVAVNCAALPAALAESELFGHERGAFTDARQARLGLFEAASGGTLFLDEVASLGPGIQAKLLTALEEGRIRRLGGTREFGIDVRIVAASNRPLRELVEHREFREDLFHRLNLVRLGLPPLRACAADLPALTTHLLGAIAARHRVPAPAITPAGMRRLAAWPWPGNIRELQHELERAVIFDTGGALDFPHLGAGEPTAGPAWRNPDWQLPAEGFSLESVTHALVAEALRETNGNVSAAARRLGVTREFLRYRLGSAPSEP